MAETNNLVLSNECGNLYSNSMHEAFSKVDTYLNQSDLIKHHEQSKNLSLTKVQFKIEVNLNKKLFLHHSFIPNEIVYGYAKNGR